MLAEAYSRQSTIANWREVAPSMLPLEFTLKRSSLPMVPTAFRSWADFLLKEEIEELDLSSVSSTVGTTTVASQCVTVVM